ncbi:MAG: hypothetical protein K1X89_28430 [Myxococcaceae bacterium]|nr:hypothetical protein [Myxococcaceae bacterium]
MDEVHYPLHKGAKVALNIVGGLLILLCVTIPVSIFVFIRVATAKVTLRRSGLDATLFVTTSIEFDDVARLGLLRVPVVAGGLGGYLARQKVGGSEAVNLVVQTKAGKDKKFIVSQFENWQELVEKVKQSVSVPCEDIKMGMLSWKWPEKP